jgi:protein-S-isoprenylcysteine O-methyltransferase Ste14
VTEAPPPQRSAGSLLFRFRSVTPLPVIAAVFVLSWRSHIDPGPGGATVDHWFNVLGPLLCLLGSSIRLVTVASAPRGSTQTRTITATTLHTTGPYAVVRHPLYLGNAFIVLGLLLVLNAPWGWGLGVPFFVVASALIIRAEERALALTFADRWASWAREVPALLPRLRRAEVRPRAWRIAIRREVNPLVAWGVGVQALLFWEWWARAELTRATARLLEAGVVALLVLLAANKVWKKVSP